MSCRPLSGLIAQSRRSGDDPTIPIADGTCYLLNVLPRELRDEIIKEALIQDEDDPSCIVISTQDSPHFAIPGLMRTNRQLRAETLPLFYSKKSFWITNLKAEGCWKRHDDQIDRTRRWLQTIEAHLHEVQMISFCLCPDHVTFLELHAVPGRPVQFDVYEEYGRKVRDRWSYCKANVNDISWTCDIGGAYVDGQGYWGIDLEGELKEICFNVGSTGFGPEEYMRALEVFLDADNDRTCDGRIHSDYETGSDDSERE